jgi:hypothetical protein
MDFQDIFKNKGSLQAFPLFASIYLSYINPNLFYICILITMNIFIFYLIVMNYAKEISKERPTSEIQVYRNVISKKKYILSAITSFLITIIDLITLVLLYFYLDDPIIYGIFWLFLTGLLFNFFRIILNFDLTKKAYKGTL